MKIYLVRPGEKELEGEEDLLTQNGERQIGLLARRLKQDGLKVSKIYSTNNLSSLKTADILCKSLLSPLVRDDRILQFQTDLFNESSKNDNLENIFAINRFVDEIVSKKQDVLLAMQSQIIRVVISYLTGISLKDMSNFAMDLANLSLIEYVEVRGVMGWRVTKVNDTTHLSVP